MTTVVPIRGVGKVKVVKSREIKSTSTVDAKRVFLADRWKRWAFKKIDPLSILKGDKNHKTFTNLWSNPSNIIIVQINIRALSLVIRNSYKNSSK